MTEQSRTWAQVVIDRDLHKRLKIYASTQESSLKEVTEQAVADYLQRNASPGQAA